MEIKFSNVTFLHKNQQIGWKLINKMPRFIKRIQNLIKKIDLFPATQFVKYKE